MSFLSGIGPIKARQIIEKLNDVSQLFELTPHQLSKLTDIPKNVFVKMKPKQALEEAEKTLEFNFKNKIQTHYYLDKKYPSKLSQCVDAPLNLFQKGNFDFKSQRFVAIVGTRDASDYGRKICKELIASFQNKNIVVVSGLAHGIDTYAHQYALEFNVPTIAVLGHGLDRIYPSVNKTLSTKIIEQSAILTEFKQGTAPDRENFPKRNRIVAGMCDATIVIESKIKGGSLITARLANDYNRDVFAFPGDVFNEGSQGCNNLISTDQAHLIQSPEDFMKIMGWEERPVNASIQPKLFNDLNQDQELITRLLSENKSLQIDVISQMLNLPMSKLNSELFSLEMMGIIVGLPGKQFRIN